MAKRIQRKRTKGWRMPANTVYVGRPSRWGNPYTPEDGEVFMDICGVTTPAEGAVFAFRAGLDCMGPEDRDALVAPLRDKNLACWCRLDQPCHADVLLELSND